MEGSICRPWVSMASATVAIMAHSNGFEGTANYETAPRFHERYKLP